jgi:hypothetical protein
VDTITDRYMCSEEDAMISTTCLWGWETQRVLVKRSLPPEPPKPNDARDISKYRLHYRKTPEMTVNFFF